MNPIDLTRLRDFSDGTESGLRDLAALFVTHMEECLRAISRGVAGQDAEVIRTEAHRGAGTFGACGAQPLAALLAEVETARRRAASRRGVGAGAEARGRSRAGARVPRCDARVSRDT